MFDLLRGKVGVLQRRGRVGHEALGVGGAELDQSFVLDPDQLCRGVATGAIPEGVDAERLDVDALAVHRRDARAGVVHQQARCLERMIDHRHRLWHTTMGVHVDGLDPLAVDHDLAPPRLGMGMGVSMLRRLRTRCGRRAHHRAAGEGDAAGRSRCTGRWYSGHGHSSPPLWLAVRLMNLQRLDRGVASVPVGRLT